MHPGDGSARERQLLTRGLELFFLRGTVVICTICKAPTHMVLPEGKEGS